MADAWGIDPTYFDVNGQEHVVDGAVIEHLRTVIGTPSQGGPLVLRAHERATVEVGPGELALEDGSVRSVEGQLPVDLPLGYHTFRAADSTGARPRRVIVAPALAHLPAARVWGLAVQLYAARSRQSWGIGDFGDLAHLAAWARGYGADFVLVNPLGAVAPTTPQQASPYYPTSRRFLNPIYLRIADVPGAPLAADAVARAAAAGTAQNSVRVIDRDVVWRLKLAALEAIWAADPPRDGFAAWRAGQTHTLERFAAWCALAERHGPAWPAWPAQLHTPGGAAVRAFAAAASERVDFHVWLQWLTARQLGSASTSTALVQDLPIGVDPNGFDAWEWQHVLAPGVCVGAPPDEFNRRGQNWGLPPFDPWKLRAADYEPFIETIRASMAAGGGLRIDHVMGLARLWWVPDGRDATEGAYVRYPADDLFAIVALESVRAGAFVVGEDLGTVEDSVRDAMAAHDVLSYRLLWFEPDDPSRWPARALAAVTTHDLPTVAGVWTGRDLAEQHAAGVAANDDAAWALRDRLASAAGLDPSVPVDATISEDVDATISEDVDATISKDADATISKDVDATVDEAIVGAHRLLARAPSMLLTVTLDDALGEAARPNIPGTDDTRPNWSLALPIPIDDIETQTLATRIAATLRDATEGAPPDDRQP